MRSKIKIVEHKTFTLIKLYKWNKERAYAKLVFKDESVTLDVLFVFEQHRGRGIAKKVFVACVDYLREKGFKQVELRSYPFNCDLDLETLTKFYERLGAKELNLSVMDGI